MDTFIFLLALFQKVISITLEDFFYFFIDFAGLLAFIINLLFDSENPIIFSHLSNKSLHDLLIKFKLSRYIIKLLLD
jgi:hypothetical protein